MVKEKRDNRSDRQIREGKLCPFNGSGVCGPVGGDLPSGKIIPNAPEQ